MKKITKLLLTAALCALTIIAAGCGGDNKAADKKADPDAPVKIGVTAGPHAEIMDNVKKLAEKQGLKIEVVEFSDYVTRTYPWHRASCLPTPCNMLRIWQQL